MFLTALNKENTWQVGTGDGSRSYAQVFFDLGIACLGSGDPGPWADEKAMLHYNTNKADKKKVGSLAKVKEGEWVIARKGLNTIMGVGRVTSRIQWSSVLEDVEGWDLQHYVNVEWYRPTTDDGQITFQSSPLPQYTISACNSQEVYDRIAITEFEAITPSSPIGSISPSNSVEIKQLATSLLDLGVRVQDADNVVAAIDRIVRLTTWYISNGPVSEDEIRSFLVNPLMVALGWPEQRIKLEHHAIDVALFKDAISRKANTAPEWIIEVKTFGNGLAFSDAQLLRYANKFPECKHFVATNGHRYVLFERAGPNAPLRHSGYFNLLNLKDRNVLNPESLTPTQAIVTLSRFN